MREWLSTVPSRHARLKQNRSVRGRFIEQVAAIGDGAQSGRGGMANP